VGEKGRSEGGRGGAEVLGNSGKGLRRGGRESREWVGEGWGGGGGGSKGRVGGEEKIWRGWQSAGGGVGWKEGEGGG